MYKTCGKYRRYTLAAGLVLIAAFILTGAVRYTSSPGFCKKCHEMEPIYKKWQLSGHSFVECIRCHSDPGITGLIKTKSQALREVYHHLTGNYRKPITIEWDTSQFSRRCLECHEGIIGKGKPHHVRHFFADISCADCHRGLVHNEKTNLQLPSREICIRCHGKVIDDR